MICEKCGTSIGVHGGCDCTKAWNPMDEIERLRSDVDTWQKTAVILGEQRDKFMAERDELQRTLDSVLVRDEQTVHREVVLLRHKVHLMRGLLETACEALEINSGKSPVWLSVDWYAKALELTRED